MSNVSGPDTHTRIYLVPHPKIVFLYPSLIVAIIAGSYAYLTKNVEGRGEHVLSLIFLVVLGINLSVIAFDFPRTTSLTVFFAPGNRDWGLVLLYRVPRRVAGVPPPACQAHTHGQREVLFPLCRDPG